MKIFQCKYGVKQTEKKPNQSSLSSSEAECSDNEQGAMVLGKLPVPGRPTI